MNKIIKFILFASIGFGLSACTVNLTNETFFEWAKVNSLKGLTFEEYKSPLHRRRDFQKQYLSVSSIKHRVRNSTKTDMCFKFYTSKEKNISSLKKYKNKGSLIKAGQTLKLGRIYVRDNDRNAYHKINMRVYNAKKYSRPRC